MVIPLRGEIWWAEMAAPKGSEPGYRRPVVVVQGNPYNRSDIATVVCVAVTSQLKLQASPGNVLLPKSASGLPKPSVANVSQIMTLNKSRLIERAGKLPDRHLQLILSGIDVVLGRETPPV